MTVSIYLGIFDICPNCSLWLLLLMLGAWFLGWLLGYWIKDYRLKAEINGLHRDIKNWKNKLTKTESEVEQAKYDREKIVGEIATTKSRLLDSNVRYKALQEKYNQLESKGGEDVGVSKLENYIVDLERKLAVSYDNITKMEADYAILKSSYGDLEMESNKIVAVPNQDFSLEKETLNARIFELELMLASRLIEDKSESGDRNKKRKVKKKSKKKSKKKTKNKKKENNYKGKEDFGGQSSGYTLAFADSNLQVIEGIGPKIEGVLHGEGIDTWKQLSNTTTDRLREILDKEGARYKMHDPSSWAEQAGLADKSTWDELVAIQKKLGSSGDKGTNSKVEKLYFRFLGFANVKPNDFKVIEGVGPKIENLLKGEGIITWKKLSKIKLEDIQVVLDNAGSSYKLANPSTWPKQAKMASNGDWTSLRNYQDKLKGGKE
jgi:predicted flap endonuclease-1-like 5' DNA nuclease